ncbi:GDP-fucose protein-O-fucosyltransferase [Trifolium pratense]|nr:GDP-fucose protein-O-fucosyltransferase [Trifolium pratense]
MGGVVNLNSLVCKIVFLFIVVLILRALLLPHNLVFMSKNVSPFGFVVQQQKFLEVPQIVWGLNNQKIAFARACLTAKMLNRTLLMPSLSASLFYKEIDLLKPISFDKVFKFDKFNELCSGFVQLGRYSDLMNTTKALELQKGSGRKWTVERDLDQLREYRNGSFDDFEVIKIVGKNPFLWHDHWPVKDYAKVFECLVLVDEISQEADRVVSMIREVGRSHDDKGLVQNYVPYVAVHMRVEIDWMIHCKKLEQRLNTNQICSSKKEIIERVGNIKDLNTSPKKTVVYLAVADKLLQNSSILEGWKEGFLPYEKKKLGVDKIYAKYPYLIQSAIDYEVCLKADVFVGNSFSTFSSLIVLERTQKMIKLGVNDMCGSSDVKLASFAYNIQGELNGPMRWVTNMSDSSLHAISYGTDHISC